ncbi:nuclear transport factor 2 family protein [Desertimonas flava]|uniref:nuclear transport factor 2 family protein n=1 Tax=Desertimonas flava TaxID=2064846 RepID=UPI000E34C44E|nr:nuclear transport factor 2 family protein [Desertimonas flava]
MNDDKSTTLSLQELSDHEEIRRIFVEYARHLDAGDHAGYASLFASDGVMAAEIGDAVGPAAIEAALDAALSPATRATFPPAVHVMNNQSIDVDGDNATTEVLWIYLTTDDDGAPTVLQAGRYTDTLVRENGRWKLARHDITRLMGRSPRTPASETRLDRLEARLRVVEDREAIWRLFQAYKHHLDQRDFKAYSELFTDDAVWVGNLGRATGPAEIEALLVRTLEVFPSDRERTHHLVLNPQIDVDGDTATATTNWAYVSHGENDAPLFEMLGHYVDRLVRTNAGWRFRRREAYSDVPYISLDGIIEPAEPTD